MFMDSGRQNAMVGRTRQSKHTEACRGGDGHSQCTPPPLAEARVVGRPMVTVYFLPLPSREGASSLPSGTAAFFVRIWNAMTSGMRFGNAFRSSRFPQRSASTIRSCCGKSIPGGSPATRGFSEGSPTDASTARTATASRFAWTSRITSGLRDLFASQRRLPGLPGTNLRGTHPGTLRLQRRPRQV